MPFPRRLVPCLGLVVLVGSTGMHPSTVQAAPDCPAPKTCADYVLTGERWPTDRAGRIVIDYRVNPRNAQIPAEHAAPMVAAATRVWERANPLVRFRFQGLTDALPGIQDGWSVIGFGPPLLPGLEAARAQTWLSDGVIVEADISVNATSGYVWQPCEQRDGGCSGHPRPIAPTGTWTNEVQGIVTHELGHWLGLDHPDSERARQLTMSEVYDTERGLEVQTLGRGDVLGLRAAYPCGACGKPVVFSP